MDNTPFKTRVRSVIISNAKIYKKFFLEIEEDLVKNSIRCSFAAGNEQCTIGFIVAEKARPMTLLKGNELDEKAIEIDCILRKTRESDMFTEIVAGDKQSVEDLAAICESVAIEIDSQDADSKLISELAR